MYVAVHAVVGAAAATAAGAGNPAGAIAIGLASHVLLDAVPHHDYGTNQAAALDVALAVAAAGLVWRFKGSPALVWAALGAVVPDIEVALASYGLLRPPLFFPSHRYPFLHHRAALPLGVLTQAIAAAAAAAALVLL